MKRVLIALVILVVLFPRQMADILSPVTGALQDAWHRIATEQRR